MTIHVGGNFNSAVKYVIKSTVKSTVQSVNFEVKFCENIRLVAKF